MSRVFRYDASSFVVFCFVASLSHRYTYFTIQRAGIQVQCQPLAGFVVTHARSGSLMLVQSYVFACACILPMIPSGRCRHTQVRSRTPSCIVPTRTGGRVQRTLVLGTAVLRTYVLVCPWSRHHRMYARAQQRNFHAQLAGGYGKALLLCCFVFSTCLARNYQFSETSLVSCVIG